MIIRNRKELEAIRDSVWFWPRSLLTSENLRTKLTPTEYNILGNNCVLFNGMEEFFERMKAENWSKDQLREELIKESHNARYWPRHFIHKIMTPQSAPQRIGTQICTDGHARTVSTNGLDSWILETSGHHKNSEKEYNRELKAVYFELFGQTNIPGHNIHYPKFDPVLYNKRRNSKYKPYRIQLCMINPVKMQDKKVWIILYLGTLE